MSGDIPWSVEELRAFVNSDKRIDPEYGRFLLTGALAEIEGLEISRSQLRGRSLEKNMHEMTKDEAMSLVALAEAEARFQRASKEYHEARKDLEKQSASINAKMPWLKRAVDFHEE